MIYDAAIVPRYQYSNNNVERWPIGYDDMGKEPMIGGRKHVSSKRRCSKRQESHCPKEKV